MAEDEVGVGLPLVSMRVASSITFSVFAIGALIAIVARSGDPLEVLAKAVFNAAFFGGFVWLFMRRRAARQLSEMPRVPGPPTYVRRGAMIRGAVAAVVASAAAMLIEALLDWAWGFSDSDVATGAGILLGFGLWTALNAADLRRWQADNGLVVMRSADRPRFVFSQSDAARHFFLVETTSDMAEQDSRVRR